MPNVVEPNIALEKKLNKVAWLVSAVVFLLVVMTRRYKIDLGIDFSFLPPFYSIVNGLSAVLLIGALVAIKRGMGNLHRRLINICMVLGALFLLSYVLYHLTTPETTYCGVGTIRYVYFFFLITHIILAGVILPFILFTYIRAYTNQFTRHKAIARWVFPFWLYVAATGPIIYLMLRPCY